MKKYASEVNQNKDGKFIVIWHTEDGETIKEEFASEELADKSIELNDLANDVERNLTKTEPMPDKPGELISDCSVTEFFSRIASINRQNAMVRYRRLLEIKAPDVILKASEMSLYLSKDEFISEYKKCIKNYFDSDETVIRHENKTGRGGKKYVKYELASGKVFNFFPQARYGMIIFPQN